MTILRSLRTILIGLAALTVAALAVTASSASASTEQFANTKEISIPDKGKAGLYPSPITVSGQPGRVTDVTVRLEGFKHDHPRDVDVMLVTPSGKRVMLVSDACGDSALPQSRWVFNQDFGAPVSAAGPCTGGVYRPTNLPGLSVDNTNKDAFPAPAPAGPYGNSLDDFVGEDPNGTWKLYVSDERTFKGGTIKSGWAITVSSVPQTAQLPAGAAGEGGPYPITQRIDGVDGLITDVNVSQGGIFHERPADLEFLLVGPGGQKVLLASDACGVGRAKNTTWAWDDEAFGPMPANACPSDSYKPTDLDPGDSLPVPAPQAPYANALSAFDNTDPNGEWKLYVADDQADARGFLTQPFKLNVQTRPRAGVAFAAPTARVAEGETAEVKLMRTGPDPLVAGSVKVTSSPGTAGSATDYEPVAATVAFAAGQREATVPVRALTDDAREGDEKFLLTVGDAAGDAKITSPAAAEVTIEDRTPEPRIDNNNGGGGAQVDREAPGIAGLRLKPTRFAVGGRTARKRGTTIRYTLSEAATVTVRVEKVRGKRIVPAGTLPGSGKAGVNSVRFTGKIGRRLLKPGSYRLRVVARDAAGNESTSAARRFRIVKKVR